MRSAPPPVRVKVAGQLAKTRKVPGPFCVVVALVITTLLRPEPGAVAVAVGVAVLPEACVGVGVWVTTEVWVIVGVFDTVTAGVFVGVSTGVFVSVAVFVRSEEHTSELQSRQYL